MYIIRKVSRDSNETYSGITWDKASLRHLYQEKYVSRKEAQEIADILTMWNSVGFRVDKVK
jgi:hypothetical protein